MTYNMTGIAQNSTSFLAFSRGVSESLTGGWMFTLFLFGIMLVMFISFFIGTGDGKRAAGASSFIGFTMAIGLRALNLVPNLVVFITLILAAIVVATTWKGD